MFDLKSAMEKAQSKISDLSQQLSGTAQTAKNVVTNQTAVFCSNCGTKLNEGAKFCHVCGATVGTATAPKVTSEPQKSDQSIPPVPPVVPTPQPSHPTVNPVQRQQEFAGNIVKCPNCGAVISHTTAICPNCGMQITGQAAVNSIQAFKEQIMAIESKRRKSHLGILNVYATPDPVDKQKLELIKNFPIPNTVDDILEFILLASSNIDVKLSKKTFNNSASSMQLLAMEMPRVISDAWVAKLQQAYQKAEILIPNDSAFPGIQKLYFDKMKELKIKVQ